MAWRVTYTRTFLKEMARLPAQIRARIEAVAFSDAIQEDPFSTNKLQKLSGYQTYYKIRIGDYRIGLHVDQQAQEVEFQRVLHRREIYRKFP